MTEGTLTVLNAVLLYLTIGVAIITLLTIINMWQYRGLSTDMIQASKSEPAPFRRVVTIYVIRKWGLGFDLPTRNHREWIMATRGLVERPAERLGVLIESIQKAQLAGDDAAPTTVQTEDGA